MKRADEINQQLVFQINGERIQCIVEKRGTVHTLTIRALHGTLIVLPDVANQIGVLVSKSNR